MPFTPAEATALAAVIAGAIGASSLWQKTVNDRRDAWWKRAQWAIDKSLSDDLDEQEIGINAMDVLMEVRGVSTDDLNVLRPAVERVYRQDDLDTPADPGDHGA